MSAAGFCPVERRFPRRLPDRRNLFPPLPRLRSAAWKALTDADKVPFAKLADKDKKRYAKEMLT